MRDADRRCDETKLALDTLLFKTNIRMKELELLQETNYIRKKELDVEFEKEKTKQYVITANLNFIWTCYANNTFLKIIVFLKSVSIFYTVKILLLFCIILLFFFNY